jgi:hypothetical protein
MMKESDRKVFICNDCKKPKSFKQMSSKPAWNGEPLCKSCTLNSNALKSVDDKKGD